jgi:hypothetical protein
MASKILVPQTLQNGFWPSSRFNPAIEDEFMDDGTLSSNKGAIVQHHRFVLVAMFLPGTFLQRFVSVLGCSGSHQPELGPWSLESDSDSILDA